MLMQRAWDLNKIAMSTIKHSCKDIQNKIELYLDGELDRYSKMHVDEIINDCPICKTEFDHQNSFKKILNVSLQRKQCNTQLRNSIVNKIRGL